MAELIAPPDPRAALRRALGSLKVFPLHGAAVLPGTPAPFHIFEPRYRALVEDALAGDRILAVPALVDRAGAVEQRPPVHPICGAGIIEAEERYPDGRFDIVVRGLARVRLVEERPARGVLYREFRAELVDDVLPAGGPAALGGELDTLRQLVLELSRKLPGESGAPQLAEATSQMRDPSAIADLVAAAAVSDPGARQRILDEADVARRVALVTGEIAGLVLVLSGKRGQGPSA